MLDAPSLSSGHQHSLPRGKSQAKGFLHVVGAAILDGEGRCLVARRAAHVSNAGYWEFPGGKVEEDEDPRRALEREIAEELALTIRAGDFLGRGQVTLENGRELVLDVYLAAFVFAGDGDGAPSPQLADHDEVRWLGAAELAGLDFAAADLPILPALASHLGRPRSTGLDQPASINAGAPRC